MNESSVESLVAYPIYDSSSKNYDAQMLARSKKPLKYHQFFIKLEQPEAERTPLKRVEILVEKTLEKSRQILLKPDLKSVEECATSNINNNANKTHSSITTQQSATTQIMYTSQSEYEQQVFFNSKIQVKIYQNKKGEILVKSMQPNNETNQNNNNINNEAKRSLKTSQAFSKSTLRASRSILTRISSCSETKSNRCTTKSKLKNLDSKDNKIESEKDKLRVKNKNLPFDLNIAFVDLALKNDDYLKN